MKTSISHIPKDKQEDLKKAVQIIKNTTYGNIWAEIIILFWSYARWDFVVKDTVFEWWWTRVYESDFDVLAITKKPTQEKNMRLSIQINKEINEDKSIESHFNIIIEDIHHVNKMLEESRYFYTDIKNEWIILYNSEKYELSQAKKLSHKRKKQIQKEDFKLWFWDANSFFKHYKIAFSNKDYRIWAFLLHQATEKYITAYLLVKTGYKPKTHDLRILYNKITIIEEMFLQIFNLSDKVEERCFELLRKAYVESRYSKTYKITKEELTFLEWRLLKMIQLVEKFCKEEISKTC